MGAGIPPRVLLVGVRDWTAPPRLPYYLHRAGADVAALIPDSCWRLAASSFLSERFAGSEDPDEALDLLRDLLGAGRRFDWIVFCDDLVVDQAALRRDERWLAGLLPVGAGAERADALVSKTVFSRLMRAGGVPMPESRGASTFAEIEAAAAAVGFPVLVKPDRGFAGVGIFSARNAAELRGGTAAATGDHLVERLVEGRVGGTPVLFDRGRPAWWSSFLKTGVWPVPYGPSCRRVAYEPQGLEPILERMGATLELHGLFGVDWIERPDGKLVVIELNGRPTPLNEGARQARRELVPALADFLAGRRAVRRPGPETGAAWHMMPQSLQLAFAQGDWLLAARLILGFAFGTDIPWNDPGILRRYAARALSLPFRKLAGRRRSPRP